VIWTKGVSTFQADYSVEDLPTNLDPPAFRRLRHLSPEKLLESGRSERLGTGLKAGAFHLRTRPRKGPLHGCLRGLGVWSAHSVAIGMQPPIAGCVYQKVSALDRCNGDLSQ
jgi:hypothetical protein